MVLWGREEERLMRGVMPLPRVGQVERRWGGCVVSFRLDEVCMRCVIRVMRVAVLRCDGDVILSLHCGSPIGRYVACDGVPSYGVSHRVASLLI